MKRFLTLTAAAAIAIAIPATAATQQPTTVTYKSWYGYQTGFDDQFQVSTRNGEYKHCASVKVTEIDAKGTYKNAKPGTNYKVIWKKNGEVFHKYTSQWIYKSGSHEPNLSKPKGLGDGRYVVIVKQSGKRLGASGTLKLTTTKGC